VVTATDSTSRRWESIRQALLRGISTWQVGRVAVTLTGEAVSTQTVSKLARVLDRAVEAFHQRRPDDCACLERAAERQCTHAK
jgi:transposase-like protein